MKELEFLKTIKETLSNSQYIGDDCAYLEDLDIFISQDTLVENEHFSLYTTTPYMLGRKVIAVNLSDLAAAMSTPKYVTVSISLPESTQTDFVKELYKGINDICNEYNVKVIGGDITGGEKVVISVCAIGRKTSLHLSSRSFAHQGDIVVVTGQFGSSACAYNAFKNFLMADDEILNVHINPTPRINEGLSLAHLTDRDIAVIDSSDGLGDALYRIAKASNHSILVDYDRVPVNDKVKKFAHNNDVNLSDLVIWGGEDYELVACVPKETFEFLDKTKFTPIGKVLNKDYTPNVFIKSNEIDVKINEKTYDENAYNHFANRIYV